MEQVEERLLPKNSVRRPLIMSSRRSGGGPSATQQQRMSFNQPGGGKDTHAFYTEGYTRPYEEFV